MQHNYKYTISILSMFKNEEMIMEEWIQHYISEGIEHFYLIDNGSTDNYGLIVNKYADKITLVVDPTRDNVATQPLLYNKHFLETIKMESEWIIIADMDEYIYSRNNFKLISDYIKTIPEHVESILMPWKNFGNNNINLQPKSIKSSFTKREDFSHYIQRIIDHNWVGHCKSLTRTKCLFHLNTHVCELNSNSMHFSDFSIVDFNPDNFKKYNLYNQNLHLNHYQNMSYEYYSNVKIKRGDAQSQNNNYTIERFHNESNIFNQTDDVELSNKK